MADASNDKYTQLSGTIREAENAWKQSRKGCVWSVNPLTDTD